MSASEDGIKRRSRSAVTSGRKLLIDGDPNSAWSRRYRDLVTRHVGDLGGAHLLFETQLSLIRRAAALAVELEQMEARSQGVEVNLDSFGRAASHLRRIYEAIGLRRQQCDVGSPLHDYWREQGAMLPTAKEIGEVEDD